MPRLQELDLVLAPMHSQKLVRAVQYTQLRCILLSKLLSQHASDQCNPCRTSNVEEALAWKSL